MSNRAMAAANAGQRATATLLLLVEDGRNRELLADQFSDAFDVRTGLDDLSEGSETGAESGFDLCLLDTASLGRYREQLRAAKANAEPAFLPSLLLTGRRRSPDELPDDVWSLVDEVIQRPVSRTELDARVDSLLHRRRLSVELTRGKARSDRRFEFLFRATPDPVIVATPDGTVTEANEAFGRTFGVDADDAAGRSITELGLSPPESVERLLGRLADGTPSSATIRWEPDEGAPFVTELHTDRTVEVGEGAERVGIFRDVTERVERERELERQNERLEEFANTIAHDLRNPLNVAQGRLHLARETGETEHFETVRASHERMARMITEILTLAKQGRVVLDPDPVGFGSVVESAWRSVRTAEASLDVDTGGPITITADEGRLRQLFENLFRNAIDHGGDRVAVRVGLLAGTPGFYVEDDGPGIPAEKREKALEAGYTDAADGTGFGLSIVQQIVEGHGWNLAVVDSDTGGARFEVSNVAL